MAHKKEKISFVYHQGSFFCIACSFFHCETCWPIPPAPDIGSSPVMKLFFGISTAVIFFNKKIGVLLFIVSFLISLARVYSGIHWPYDIIGGLIVGVASGLVVVKVPKFFKR